MEAFVVVLFFVAVATVVFVLVKKARDKARAGGGFPDKTAKPEAYFKAMFPELQPYFHPEKVVSFVGARHTWGSTIVKDGWKSPPGFATASAVIIDQGGREQVRLMDAAGAVLAEFSYEAQPHGAALRVGRGKLTADLDHRANPHVRYWHPDREFKWSRKGGWRFTTRVAEEPFDSNSSGTSWSNERSSSATGAAVAAGAVAALVAGGGASGGAGASAAWDAENAGGDNAGGGNSAGTAY